MKIVSWNINRRKKPWACLLDMDADIALVQGAGEPPPEVAEHIETDAALWQTEGADVRQPPRPWHTAVVKLSERVQVEWLQAKALAAARRGDLAVSQLGTLAAATVTAPGRQPLVVVSMYAPWTRPHTSTGSHWILSDASAHRVVSDLSAFIGNQHHRILAAGDLNILYGHGEHGSAYWAARYETVFTRLAALGLSFVGPQAPQGRQADPWPAELPRTSRNVPTYHHNRQTPATATRQLDFVFASESLADTAQVRALNEVEHWGPSDHRRLEIVVP